VAIPILIIVVTLCILWVVANIEKVCRVYGRIVDDVPRQEKRASPLDKKSERKKKKKVLAQRTRERL